MRLIEQGNVKQAFPLLSRAARAGIAEAEYRVGRCYLEGAGVPPSRAEGARWLERAANQGYVEAQAQLATLAIHGLTASSGCGAESAATSCSPATRRPRRISRPASAGRARRPKAAPPMARRCSGYILTSGPEHVRDLDEAHRWYERSAAAGCPQGALGYALSLARDARRRRSSRRRWRRTCAAPRMPDCRRRCICWAS